MARSCPKLMTNRQKRFLSSVVKELEDAKQGKDDL
jgi:hypothetical protein